MNIFIVKKNIPICVACGLLVLAVLLSIFITAPNTSTLPGESAQLVEAKANIITPQNGTYYKHNEEMKAVWVSFMSLTAENEEYSETAFKEKFNKIVKTTVDHKLNTLIVHVRPYGDALYPSDIFPWSHILTGTQGEDPEFDPLAYMVDAAHNAELEFHAWINPLRIKVNDTPKKLSKDNLFNQWKEDEEKSGYILKWEDGYYLNPAITQVRELIISGVEEIVRNYAVDGIHFDDYFYPTSDADYDKESYQAYLGSLDEECSPLVLTDWRSANINKLISGVYSRIHYLTSEVEFGVSPQGNINNDIDMGADVYAWCQTKGYIDYICPQIYVNFEHSLLPYDDTAKEWKELITNEDIDYYIGLAVYKAGSEDDDGTWENQTDILKQQIEFGREIGADGFMLYSWDYLEDDQTKEEIENVMAVF